MVEVICLDNELLESEFSNTRREISRPHYDIPALIKSKDSKGAVSSREASITLESLVKLLGTQKAIFETLAESSRFNGGSGFLMAYSYLLSAENSLNILSAESSSNKFFSESSKIDFGLGEHTIRNFLLEKYKSEVQKCCDNPKDIVSITNGFLKWIKGNARHFYDLEENSKNASIANNLHIKLNGVAVSVNGIHNGFSHLSLSADRSQVVGNTELISQIDRSFKLLFLYDAKSKEHPHIQRYGAFVQRILAYGPPGSGKSFTVEAMSNEANNIASQYAKSLRIKDISNDLKSKYYSESAHNVRKLFDEVEKGDSVYIIVADDIDTFVLGRSENEYSENISVFGELIKCLESVNSNNLGNYLLLAVTNIPERLDPALLRRFQKKIYVKGLENREDYESLLRIKLEKYVADGLLRKDALADIGCLLYDNNVSGSVVSDIASSLADKMIEGASLDELYSMNSKEAYAKLKDYYKPLDISVIKEIAERKIGEGASIGLG